jgi:pimeloyl-ACP methyl ester carboxylesterase
MRFKRRLPVLIILFVLLAGLGVIACRFGPAPLEDPGGGGINELTQVELGGLRQWISIRGTDAGNPVLLFLHGGPGSANLAKLRMQCPGLEEHFVVVNWDQRGSGKTHTLRMGESGLTLEQLREDARQLVKYLRERFGGRKIYLMGFSWGTALGLMTVRDHPEDFLGYIGVSQVVNYAEGERLSLEYVRRIARETDNRKAVDELERIDPAYRSDDWYAQLMRERSWLLKFGGVYHTADNYRHELKMLLGASEYSFLDFAWWPMGSDLSLRTLWPELMNLNFFKSAPRIGVPVYFLEGRLDANAPSGLAQEYFDRLLAPHGKRWIWFEKSAHDIFFDQPVALADALVGILQPPLGDVTIVETAKKGSART